MVWGSTSGFGDFMKIDETMNTEMFHNMETMVFLFKYYWKLIKKLS